MNDKISKETLEDLYKNKKFSAKQIALKFKCSENKINYWLSKFGISKRTISDATFVRNKTTFFLNSPKSNKDYFLLGLGIGLYWGEGNKKNDHAVRLGNTDPYLILSFIRFLEFRYRVSRSSLKFGVQIFNDLNPEIVQNFWIKKLEVSAKQFYKPTVTVSKSVGTYTKKSEYGVLTVYLLNKKIRDHLVGEIEHLQRIS